MDDRIVIEEMLKDFRSEYWYECYLSIKRLVQVQAKNIPKDQWNDIVQDAMVRVHRYLPTFKYQCAFRTWLFGIVRSCIIDNYRKSARAGLHIFYLSEPNDDVEREGDVFTAQVIGTVEGMCIAHEELNQALIALREYVTMHPNPIRNGRILAMVILENRSLEEVAQSVGCSAPVVGYVVRSAQRYVREKFRNQL
jgi:RNA polymerase sigma factor (sigma-70 family)